MMTIEQSYMLYGKLMESSLREFENTGERTRNLETTLDFISHLLYEIDTNPRYGTLCVMLCTLDFKELMPFMHVIWENLKPMKYYWKN